MFVLSGKSPHLAVRYFHTYAFQHSALIDKEGLTFIPLHASRASSLFLAGGPHWPAG